ncbi:MAG: hypothetical protein JXQ90_18275 [Cyclobacteriaceae bacterium]
MAQTDSGNIILLKKLIKIEMAKCDPDLWPKVCALQSTEEGYQKIESMIIQLAIKEAMPIGSVIALVEQDLSHSTQ